MTPTSKCKSITQMFNLRYFCHQCVMPFAKFLFKLGYEVLVVSLGLS
jgi:hypothetical protein